MIPTIPVDGQIRSCLNAHKVAKSMLIESVPTLPVLDTGYVKLVDFYGSDESIIEAARMSTNKGFNGWGHRCANCGESSDWIHRSAALQEATPCPKPSPGKPLVDCGAGGHMFTAPGDEKLLRYLWENRHATPFEMAGMIVEVKLPIFVVREWQRHRTQGYNEMSARYVPLPDENYVPTVARIIEGAKVAGSNRQAQGLAPLHEHAIEGWLSILEGSYRAAQQAYAYGIEVGIPKELARLSVPVARYTRMRCTANLRNILGFMSLRYHPKAQWEIQEYAKAWGSLLRLFFERTVSLWEEGAELP